MNERSIYVTDYDLYRLHLLTDASMRLDGQDNRYLRDLKRELDRAEVVKSARVPPSVITMNSRFRLRDMDSEEAGEYALVFPDKANTSRGMLSVLAPIGTALLGCRELETVECEVPAGMKRFQVVEILYQPEAAYEYHL